MRDILRNISTRLINLFKKEEESGAKRRIDPIYSPTIDVSYSYVIECVALFRGYSSNGAIHPHRGYI